MPDGCKEVSNACGDRRRADFRGRDLNPVCNRILHHATPMRDRRRRFARFGASSIIFSKWYVFVAFGTRLRQVCGFILSRCKYATDFCTFRL